MSKSIFAAVAALALWGASPSPGSVMQNAATACSSPKLPPSILNGPAPHQSGKSLTLIPVVAPLQRLILAVASTESDRELGLMCVTALAPQHGMIFVFAGSGLQQFWMKRTLVPLDMVWVAADGRVTSVAADVPASSVDTPDDAVARRSGEGRFVIELRGGEAALDGVRPGVRLALPTLRAPN